MSHSLANIQAYSSITVATSTSINPIFIATTSKRANDTNQAQPDDTGFG